jgi:predicted DCC family thiol-disulfide oxidoreductase YuxK
VLYDPQCRLCAFGAGWLTRQRQLVPLDLVPAGSAEAHRRFPALDHTATGKDVTVVGDAGQVFRGDAAWVVCLWALADHRAFSHTLTTPAGRRLARAAVLSAAKYRASARHSTAPPPPERTKRYGMAPGWTYDRVTGWTQDPSPGWTYEGDGRWAQADGDACADGCTAGPD